MNLQFSFSQTLMIIMITCIVSMLAFGRTRLLDRLIFWPPAIKRWQFSRFITHGFIHADFQHLLFNMITLYFFGQAIENFYSSKLGGLGFIAFYLMALVVAIFPSYIKNYNNITYRSLGASGAVSAVLFAFVILHPWHTIYVYVIPVPAIIYAVLYTAYSIYSATRNKDNINHSAHMSGALFGIIATMLMQQGVLGNFLNAIMHPTLSGF